MNLDPRIFGPDGEAHSEVFAMIRQIIIDWTNWDGRELDLLSLLRDLDRSPLELWTDGYHLALPSIGDSTTLTIILPNAIGRLWIEHEIVSPAHERLHVAPSSPAARRPHAATLVSCQRSSFHDPSHAPVG